MKRNLNPQATKFQSRMLNSFVFNIFLLFKLPLAFMAGLRLKKIDTEKCVVSMPFGWRNQNPFKSIYFAAMAMAAELSTGTLLLLAIENSEKSVAMLVVNLEGGFTRKADATTTFTCAMGDEIFSAIEETCRTGQPVKVKAETIGKLADGTEVARFYFTWSVKKRANQ